MPLDSSNREVFSAGRASNDISLAESNAAFPQAVLSSDAPYFSVQQAADYIRTGTWGDLVFDVAPGDSLTVNLTGLTATGANLARWALEMWSDVLGIDFVEVSGSAQINFQDNESGAFAGPEFYNPSTNKIVSSVVNVSQAWIASSGTEFGSYSFQTYLHEIGHALGFGHTGDYNGSATFGVDNLFQNDSWQMSVMSYFSQTENTHIDASFAYVVTPMIADIVAAQDGYGVPTNVRQGNTTYGANANFSGVLAAYFSIVYDGAAADPSFYNGDPVTLTIFDSGGYDTIDLTTVTYNQVIDLNPGGISDVNGLTGNWIIALNTIIEAYKGGSGVDTVTGNSADNLLLGGAGNDVLAGAGGNDRLWGQDGADRLDGGTGNDELYGGNGDDILMGGAGNDKLYGGIWSDTLWGQDGADRLYGERGNDKLYGGNGDDILLGGDGDDKLYGGIWSDTLWGQNGNDWLYGQKGDDKLYGGNGNDILVGGEGRDILVGSAGNDKLWAGAGADRLTGGTGDDFLFGGGGSDVFVFNTFNSGEVDTIADFQDGVDMIEMSGVSGGFSALSISEVTVESVDYVQVLYNGQTILISGVDITNLTEADFSFL